jgi:hypothetical protein
MVAHLPCTSVVEPSGAAVERFARLAVDGPLDAAVLAIASALRPPVDEAAGMGTLDDWAAQCDAPTFDAVRKVLFARVGLTGDTDDYSDPENSMLDAVIARARGIPITLSIVAIEVARRVGAVVEPIGMPGHFLVRDRATGLYCDAFAGGTLLDERGCEARFRTMFGPGRPFSVTLLEPTPRPLVLARVLANLEASRWAVDPRRLRTMLELHRRVPALDAAERLRLATRLESVGAFGAAASEADAAATLLAPGPDQRHAVARANAARARTN